MALVTISGFPCSGKSTRVEQLSVVFRENLLSEAYHGPITKISVLSDDVLGISRSSYDDSRSEKPARGVLFTALQRQMAPDTILVVDALNYIKGFRYQMYCAAREAKLRVCTIHVVATKEHCKQWNEARQDGRAYKSDTLENLIFRYEEPSSMVRWDSPLFTVPWDDDAFPGPQIWEAITKGDIKPPNAATNAILKAPTDALQALEQTTASIVSGITADQSGYGGKLNLSISTPSTTLKLCPILPPRNITLSELQRIKRQFVTLHKKALTLGATDKGPVDWSEESIAAKFITFLEEHVKS